MADAALELERLIRRMDATNRAVAALQAEQAALREAVQRLSGAPRLWPDSQVRVVLRLVAEDYGMPPRLLIEALKGMLKRPAKATGDAAG